MTGHLLLGDICKALSNAVGEDVGHVEPGGLNDVSPLAPSTPESCCDLVLRGGPRVFVVEYKAEATADLVGGAIRQLHACHKAKADDGGEVVRLVVVPFMGETGKLLCREAGISWLDLSGNADIRAQGLRVRLEGKPNQYKRRGRHKDLFAPGSSRIAHALLLHPDREYTQTTLADETALSAGTVSLVVRRYAQAGFVERTKTGRTARVRLADGDLLLDAWSEAYDFAQHELWRGHTVARTGEEALQRLARELPQHGVEYAATGLAAAWVIEPFAMFRLVTLYVSQWPSDETLRDLRLRGDVEGGNVWLVRPRDEGVFLGSETHRGVRHVSTVQTYLDLQNQPERSEEAAEQLRLKHLAWKAADGSEPDA